MKLLPEPKVRPIEIRTPAGYRIIRATVYGELATHPNLDGGGYGITHLRTGYSVGTSGLSLTQDQALELLTELLAAEIDWAFSDPYRLPRTVKRAASRVLRAFYRRHHLTAPKEKAAAECGGVVQ